MHTMHMHIATSLVSPLNAVREEQWEKYPRSAMPGYVMFVGTLKTPLPITITTTMCF